ncbi:MAG: branched-chain amino acid transaminase [Desulfobacca sp.]|uniref:branched-chain amino acid transaminase n=1 Tax=Desulfobacca sp. TaxID=2067990 RepID=UPI00404A7772
MVDKAHYIWLDGKLVPWDQAQVHVLTHTLHYGLGVFEGIRAYQCRDGRTAIFRLPEHIRRLFDSAHIMELQIPFSAAAIQQACIDTMRQNEQKEAYLRPLVFIGDGAMGLHPKDNPVRVAIITWVWGAYLGDAGLQQGIRLKTSSHTRHHVNVMMTSAKVVGNYVNSILAKREVTRAGYDEALLLDPSGYVAEASGENVFLVKDGVLKTPPLTTILPGITRDCILTIARDLGLPVQEVSMARDELYIADEVFLTGTAAEITPVRELDDRTIGTGRPGPITKRLQGVYFAAVKGENPDYASWLTYI